MSGIGGMKYSGRGMRGPDANLLDGSDGEDNPVKALVFHPASAQAYYELGHVYYVLERLQEAFAAYAKVLEINPINKKAYYNMGLVAYRQGQLNFALEFMQRVPKGIAEYEKAQGVMDVIRNQR